MQHQPERVPGCRRPKKELSGPVALWVWRCLNGVLMTVTAISGDSTPPWSALLLLPPPPPPPPPLPLFRLLRPLPLLRLHLLGLLRLHLLRLLRLHLLRLLRLLHLPWFVFFIFPGSSLSFSASSFSSSCTFMAACPHLFVHRRVFVSTWGYRTLCKKSFRRDFGGSCFTTVSAPSAARQ